MPGFVKIVHMPSTSSGLATPSATTIRHSRSIAAQTRLKMNPSLSRSTRNGANPYCGSFSIRASTQRFVRLSPATSLDRAVGCFIATNWLLGERQGVAREHRVVVGKLVELTEDLSLQFEAFRDGLDHHPGVRGSASPSVVERLHPAGASNQLRLRAPLRVSSKAAGHGDRLPPNRASFTGLFPSGSAWHRMIKPIVQSAFGPRVGHEILSSWTTPRRGTRDIAQCCTEERRFQFRSPPDHPLRNGCRGLPPVAERPVQKGVSP